MSTSTATGHPLPVLVCGIIIIYVWNTLIASVLLNVWHPKQHQSPCFNINYNLWQASIKQPPQMPNLFVGNSHVQQSVLQYQSLHPEKPVCDIQPFSLEMIVVFPSQHCTSSSTCPSCLGGATTLGQLQTGKPDCGYCGRTDILGVQQYGASASRVHSSCTTSVASCGDSWDKHCECRGAWHQYIPIS